jgi:hypothetical protein
MRNPDKNKTATIPLKTGGKYSFNYADLPGTFDAVRSALSEEGLSHTFGTVVLEYGVLCACRLSHSSGQWYESELLLPKADDNKTLAANLTYFRRYLFSGLVGVAGEEDLDDVPENEGATYTDRKTPPKASEPPQDKPKISAAPAPVVKPVKVAAVKSAGNPGRLISEVERKHLVTIAELNNWKIEDVVGQMKLLFNKTKALELTMPEYQELAAIIATEKPDGSDGLFDAPASIHEVK